LNGDERARLSHAPFHIPSVVDAIRTSIVKG
jgi:hypothetical protein